MESFTMANTRTSLHCHFVFNNKAREPWIPAEIEQHIWSFMGRIARENKIRPIRIGCVDDHVHLLLNANTTLTPSKISQLIKGGSSTWIHRTFPDMKDFKWQDAMARSPLVNRPSPKSLDISKINVSTTAPARFKMNTSHF